MHCLYYHLFSNVTTICRIMRGHFTRFYCNSALALPTFVALFFFFVVALVFLEL